MEQSAFFLVRSDGSQIDICFPHAIARIEGAQKKAKTSQTLKNYKNAARTAIQEQTRRFRDSMLLIGDPCPVSGQEITRTNCEVDHKAPKTFDKLLFDYTTERDVSLQAIEVGSRDGDVADFTDREFEEDWQNITQRIAIYNSSQNKAMNP